MFIGVQVKFQLPALVRYQSSTHKVIIVVPIRQVSPNGVVNNHKVVVFNEVWQEMAIDVEEFLIGYFCGFFVESYEIFIVGDEGEAAIS